MAINKWFNRFIIQNTNGYRYNHLKYEHILGLPKHWVFLLLLIKIKQIKTAHYINFYKLNTDKRRDIQAIKQRNVMSATNGSLADR